MSKFKQKEKRTVPNPPSGSLSDIVFMLLFFFMVTTTMRETESKVMVKLPEASESLRERTLHRTSTSVHLSVLFRISTVMTHVSSSTTHSRQLTRSVTSSQLSATHFQRLTDHS